MTVAWKAQQELGNRRMIRLMAWVALSWGRPVARALLFPICLYYFCRSIAAQRTLRTYYVRALGRSPDWKELFHHYHCFASTILDRLYFLRGHFDQFAITIKGGGYPQPGLGGRARMSAARLASRQLRGGPGGGIGPRGD